MAIELSNFTKNELDRMTEHLKGDMDNRGLPEDMTVEGVLKNQQECNQRLISIVNAIDVAMKTAPPNSNFDWERETLYRIMSLRPLTPLTGEDDEWTEVVDIDIKTLNYLNFGDVEVTCLEINKRDASVFRINKNSEYAWDVNPRIFTSDNGASFHKSWKSAAKITFPYMGPSAPDLYDENAELEDCAYIDPVLLMEKVEGSSVEHLDEEDNTEANSPDEEMTDAAEVSQE